RTFPVVRTSATGRPPTTPDGSCHRPPCTPAWRSLQAGRFVSSPRSVSLRSNSMSSPNEDSPSARYARHVQRAPTVQIDAANARELYLQLYGVIPYQSRRTSVADRKEILKSAIRRNEEELHRLERFPDEDPFSDGTVITYVQMSGRPYTFAALRAAGGWY